MNAGDGTSFTYSWTGPNNFSSSDANPIIANAGTVNNGSYSLIITDENGCSANATIEVFGIEDEIAEPVITGTPQGCDGETIILSIDPVVAVSYTHLTLPTKA